MNENEILKYINLCKKSNSVVYGIDAIKQTKQKVYFILVDKTAGNALKKSANFFKQMGVSVLEIDSVDKIMSTSNCKAVGFLNQSLANTLKSKF